MVQDKLAAKADHPLFNLTNELVTLAHDVRASGSTDHEEDKSTAKIQGQYDYQEEQILPKVIELIHPNLPQLRANIVEGGYSCWEQYYDTQFRLLREDFVAPLR